MPSNPFHGPGFVSRPRPGFVPHPGPGFVSHPRPGIVPHLGPGFVPHPVPSFVLRPAPIVPAPTVPYYSAERVLATITFRTTLILAVVTLILAVHLMIENLAPHFEKRWFLQLLFRSLRLIQISLILVVFNAAWTLTVFMITVTMTREALVDIVPHTTILFIINLALWCGAAALISVTRLNDPAFVPLIELTVLEVLCWLVVGLTALNLYIQRGGCGVCCWA
ncbi:hypothetical protein C8J56DRAFT_1042486 [Mycena floridula]|nr:hypothetical protein C8J56DRAFT_1042486 [Mycena floridula]